MIVTEYRHTHYSKAMARSLFRDWVHTEYAHWEKGLTLADAGAPGSLDNRVLQDVLQALLDDQEGMPDTTVAELFHLYDMVGEDGHPEVTEEEFPEWRRHHRLYSYQNGVRTVRAFLHHMETLREADKGSGADPH